MVLAHGASVVRMPVQWCWPMVLQWLGCQCNGAGPWCFSGQFLGSSSFNVHTQFILIYVENIPGTDMCYGPAHIIAGSSTGWP